MQDCFFGAGLVCTPFIKLKTKLMYLQEFNNLEQPLQFVTLLEEGTFLCYRIVGVYMVKLFQVGDFYVETYQHIEHDRMDCMRNFTDPDELLPYWKKIKINL